MDIYNVQTFKYIFLTGYNFIFPGGYWSIGTLNLGIGIQHLS
jgi:hypothetical protein